MKIVYIVIFLLSFSCFANEPNHGCLYTNKYESPRYKIKVVYCCEEGELDCDNIYYEGIRKKDKTYIKLKGKTINDYLSHRFLGYQFKNNDYIYIIQDNALSIYKNDKLLQKEFLNQLTQ